MAGGAALPGEDCGAVVSFDAGDDEEEEEERQCLQSELNKRLFGLLSFCVIYHYSSILSGAVDMLVLRQCAVR